MGKYKLNTRKNSSEIQRLESPALVQFLIKAAIDYNIKPMRKTERLLNQLAKELLIRLGNNKKEARELADKITEQMQ